MTFAFKLSHAVLVLVVTAFAASASAQRIHALRFDTDGTLDTVGFGSEGEAVVLPPGSLAAYANDVVALSTGKSVFAGVAHVNGANRFMVGQLNANGTPDTSFSQDGFAYVNETASGTGRALTYHRGKIVAVGTKYVSATVTTLVAARFLTDGSPDSTFGNNGVVEVTIPSFQAVPRAVAIAPQSERVVIAGTRSAAGDARFLVVRLENDGDPDPTFSSDGTRTVDFNGSAYDYGNALVTYYGKTEDVGYIAIAGTVRNGAGQERCGVAMLDHSGALTSFGRKVIEFPFGTEQTCEAAEYVGGDILLGGRALNGGDGRFALTKINTSGQPVTAFSGDGYLAIDFANCNYEQLAELRVSGTTIVAAGGAETAGQFNVVTAVAKITASGLLDTTFSSDGKVTYDAPAYYINFAAGVAIEGDGQIVTVGDLEDSM